MLFCLLNGLAFGGLGLAAYLRLRQDADLPLRKQLPWLSAFGFACGVTAWIDMFLASGSTREWHEVLTFARMILQPVTGLLLLKFGWGVFRNQAPLPAWAMFAPAVLIVPLAYVVTYASTTFITPSPIEIPIDIWSRYLLYLPGSLLAGVGFLRQWRAQQATGYHDVAALMLGAGFGFLFEALVVGLVVPAAPYGPASYYNYNRIATNAFIGEQYNPAAGFGLTAWLDYERTLSATGLPIEFWRMLSAIIVTFFVVRSFGVFDAIQKRKVRALQDERDRAQRAAFQAEIAARETAEGWTDAFVSISRRIAELDDVDHILLYIVHNTRRLLGSDFSGLAIADRDSCRLGLKYYSTAAGSRMADPPLPLENPLVLDVFHTSRPYRSREDEPPGMLGGICFFTSSAARAVAIVPLDLDNRTIGAFWAARFAGQPFSETDLIWLECLADQVVIAIKHGLMTAQLQSLSITEERGRIAREMHDGLAQVLGYLNLQVQTLEALLQQRRWDKLEEKLGQMREAIQLAHADVRESILSLRTTLANEKGVIPAIAEYLEEFGIQTKVGVQFVNEVAADTHLSSIAEVQLVCILQEALTNVRKHAGTDRAWVRIARRPDGLEIVVEDHGRGFDLRQATAEGRQCFGLDVMRERAASVGGELALDSRPGEGTRVRVWVPLAAGRER